MLDHSRDPHRTMVICKVKGLAIGITSLLRPNKNKNKIINHKDNNYDNTKDNNITNHSRELTIYHQNVRGLSNKIHELEAHVLPLLPHIICLTEHHLSNQEIGNISINQYLLGAFYCRSSRKFGGVNIFVHESLTHTNIDVNRYCHDYDLEACALKFKTRSEVYCIVSIGHQLVTFPTS